VALPEWEEICRLLEHSNSEISQKRIIRRAPGYALANLAKWVFSKKVYERTFEPLLGDLQFEYCEAIKEGNNRHAQWIHFRYVFHFAKAIVLFVPGWIFQALFKWWKAT